MDRHESTAGRGDPYWYEWFVGLAEVVELLDPTSEIASVAFQVSGVKGWDDVVVCLKNGKRRCYQVKHTRVENDLTFGDLVARTEDKPSLVQTLFTSWREAGLNDGGTKCILYTNREAGQRWSTTGEGTRRPPLVKFCAWLRVSLDSAKSISELVPPIEFSDAWEIWLAELDPGSDTDRFEFLRALEIRDTEADLDGLVERVHEKLAKAFGVAKERVIPLMDTLHRALRTWTTGHPGVTVEVLCSTLALPPEPKEQAPAPPPPTPFFPSRVLIAEDLEKALRAPETEPVVLLTAEPGAGKTSVISWLTNRRVDVPFSGVVDARFFCFEPIRPENPIIAPDASRVHPTDLWFSFLTQIREGLRGRLHELKVPLRNNLLTWQEAREHVVRLADLLGREHGQRFVLAIDGIDHAARAAQTSPQQAADFFASLPSPDELSSKHIRLFLAGQPPEHYEQYPAWLRSPHPMVRRVDLALLSTEDVDALYSSVQVQFPPEQRDAAIRVIEDNAKGNTLATVFAVHEAQSASTVEKLAERLRSRRLGDGLVTYYSAIWTHMLEAAGDSAGGVEVCLAGAISMARRGIRPELLSATFAEWQKPAPWWRSILEALGPLLSEEQDGFRVRHNDVRVFLAARFAGFSETQRKRVAGQLADYFKKPDSDRIAAHLQLFDLLRLAGRPEEQADVFDVDWVFEAAALGIETDQLMSECKAAIQSLAQRKKWSLVISVACATQTLDRLADFREYSAAAEDHVQGGLPPFLPSEISVRPRTQWITTDFSQLVFDADRLLCGGEPARASGLLQRWLDGMTLSELVGLFPDKVDHFGSHQDGIKPADETRIAPFRHLGNVCATVGWAIPPGEPKSKVETRAVLAFEEGFVKFLGPLEEAGSLEELLEAYQPYYLSSWESLLRRLADAEQWTVVREALELLRGDRQRLTAMAQAEAAWWAIRSGEADDDQGWLAPLEAKEFGIPESERSDFSHEGIDRKVRAFVAIARAIGWRRIGLEPGDIGSLVYEAYEPAGKMAEHRPAGVLVFRAAAMLGRIALASKADSQIPPGELVAATEVGAVLTALWSDRVFKDIYFNLIASDLAEELAVASGLIGGDHASAARVTAQPLAETFPADFRKSGIWSVIQAAGDTSLLKAWVRHWLADDGAIWGLSRDEVYSISDAFTPLAITVGEDHLVRRARERRKWMLIGYQGHKEYGFQYVLDWFRNASRNSPQIWKDAGWKLWCACLACEEQGGDNRMRSDILDAISGAAIRCGASDWNQLASTTLPSVSDPYWHSQTCNRLVDGAVLAFDEGLKLPSDDMLNLWGLCVSFSFWTDSGDNGSLIGLRKGMLESLDPTPREQARLKLERLTPRAFRDPPLRERKSSADDSPIGKPEQPSFETTLAIIDRGEPITLAAAAAAIRHIRESQKNDEVLVSRLIRSVGTGKDYVTAWFIAETSTDKSLRSIAADVGDEQLWALVDRIGRELEEKSNWLSVFSNLLQMAAARADARGFEEILDGLSIQLDMHIAWAYGTGPFKRPIPAMPAADSGLNWQDVALRFLKVLLESYCAEVIAAALEGMHALVAVDGGIIRRLFATLSSRWARRWLFNAAESWAALHPDALGVVRDDLEREMNGGDFEGRIQAWIVLCRLSDSLKIPRPVFPVPAGIAKGGLARAPGQRRIMHSPPVMHGHSHMVDRHSGAASKLRRLASCGLNFSAIESQVAEALNAAQAEQTKEKRKNGAWRRGTMLCTPLYDEEVVGKALWSIMSDEWCEQDDLVRIAQGYLCNEDAWIQGQPPLPTKDASGWPDLQEYGPGEKDRQTIKTEMINLAMRHEVPTGWRTFSARVIDFTWKEDFVVHLWYEQVPQSLLLRPTTVPTCPSGRTFLWWIDDFFEPETDSLFVSGFFAGGMCRLNHCNVEIVPSKFWKESMKWQPEPTNPFVWCDNGRPIAMYERLHGILRDNPQSAKVRQPALHRWLIKEEAFAEIERIIGPLRLKDEFDVFRFEPNN